MYESVIPLGHTSNLYRKLVQTKLVVNRQCAAVPIGSVPEASVQ